MQCALLRIALQPQDKMKKKLTKAEAYSEIASMIEGNPVLKIAVGLGSLRVPETWKAAKIVEAFNPGGDVAAFKQEAHNVINRITQLFGQMMTGELKSARAFHTGNVMASVAKTPLGKLMSDAMAQVVDRAVADVKLGISPEYIKSPNSKTKEMEWNYSAACAVLRKRGFEKFDRSSENVRRLLDAQISSNAKAQADKAKELAKVSKPEAAEVAA
jgi:hypothetical protein